MTNLQRIREVLDTVNTAHPGRINISFNVYKDGLVKLSITYRNVNGKENEGQTYCEKQLDNTDLYFFWDMFEEYKNSFSCFHKNVTFGLNN